MNSIGALRHKVHVVRLSRAARVRSAPSTESRALAALLLILSACSLAACGGSAIRPVDILPEDMCSYCRMAISERRCASEFIQKDGTAFKFDDLGCMSNYLRERGSRENIEAYFVSDYEGEGWISAHEAFFVHATQIRTPMGGGTVAFKERAKADAAASRYNGVVNRFDEVMK